MADVSLELLAANQRKMMEMLREVRDKLDDLAEIKTMLRLQRELIDIGGLDRSLLESQIARLEKRVSRLEHASD